MSEQAALRDKIDELTEENRQLKEAIAPKLDFPIAWRLRPAESAMLACLYSSPTGFRRHEALRAASATTSMDDKIVHVRVSHIRKKLTPLGIEIRGVWSQGYELLPASRAIIKEALSQ